MRRDRVRHPEPFAFSPWGPLPAAVEAEPVSRGTVSHARVAYQRLTESCANRRNRIVPCSTPSTS